MFTTLEQFLNESNDNPQTPLKIFHVGRTKLYIDLGTYQNNRLAITLTMRDGDQWGVLSHNCKNDPELPADCAYIRTDGYMEETFEEAVKQQLILRTDYPAGSDGNVVCPVYRINPEFLTDKQREKLKRKLQRQAQKP